MPYIFPIGGLGPDPALSVPAAATARAGWFAYDTMTLIGPGTWEAARGAADAALTAAELVLAGETAAYAACRPPGHHAARGCFGGSCYLNNTAIAAARMRDEVAGPVAVIDVDAHHGNGTQQIFYEDATVLVGSVHVDPGAGWFPHFLGFEAETGGGAGAGTNRNLCLAPGSGDQPWLDAVAELSGWAHAAGARALVVALGVDAAAGDPESPLAVSAEGFREAGRRLGRARAADRDRPGGRLRPGRDRRAGRRRPQRARGRAGRLAADRPVAGAVPLAKQDRDHGLGPVRIGDRIATGALRRALPGRPQELEGAAVDAAAADRVGVAA